MSEYLQPGQHPDADQIGAFMERALPAHEREWLLNHLAVCPECRVLVALSLPPVEEPAQALAASARKPWWSGWTLAWPAAAAVAALTVFAVYIHRAPPVPNAPASNQIAISHLPAPPASQGQSPTLSAKPSQSGSQAQPAGADRAASASRAGLEPRQIAETETMSPQLAEAPQMQDRKVTAMGGVAQGLFNLPAGSPEQNARFGAPPRVVGSSGVGGGLARAPSAPASMAPPSPSSQAAEVGSAAPIGTVSSGAANMVLAAEAQAAQLKHPLPSRLPVLSMAAQAHLIVAVDTRNAVFLSRDDGRHWKAIRTQWQGRAVRTDLVKLPVGDRTGFSQDKEAGRVALQVAAAEPAGNLNSAEVAQARSLSVLPGSSLAGTVTDRTGAVIPGATVVVLDSATHTARAVRTDSAGRYLVDGLAPGIYELEARSPGFKKETLAAVAVAASQPAIANLSLTVGAATQTVTVTSAPPLETEAVGASAKEISVSKKTKARLAVPSQPTPVFEITTDNGERWTSADGVTWKHN